MFWDRVSGIYDLFGKCRELVATDYSEGMLKQVGKKCGSFPNVEIRSADILKLPYSDEFFEGAGFVKIRTKLIDGRVPCAVAVIPKPEKG